MLILEIFHVVITNWSLSGIDVTDIFQNSGDVLLTYRDNLFKSGILQYDNKHQWSKSEYILIASVLVSDFYKQTNSEIHYQSIDLHIKCNISHLMVYSAIFRFRWGVLSLQVRNLLIDTLLIAVNFNRYGSMRSKIKCTNYWSKQNTKTSHQTQRNEILGPDQYKISIAK